MEVCSELSFIKDSLLTIAFNNSFNIKAIQGIDPFIFKNISDEQGLSAFLYPFFAKYKNDIPLEIYVHLKKRYEEAMVFKVFANGILGEIHRITGNAARIVIIQGMAMMETVYHEGWVRQMGDIDLYFPDGNILEFEKAVESMGFRRWLAYKHVWTREGFFIDIHEDLWGEKRIPRRNLLKPKSKIEIVSSKTMPGYFILAPESLLLHTMFHCIKHAFSRMIWDIDIILLAKKIKFEGFFDNYSDRMLSIVSYRISYMYGADITCLPGIKGKPHCFRRKFLEWIYKHNTKEGAGEILLAMLGKGFIDSIMYLAKSIIPSREVLSQMYGKKSYIYLIFKRIGCLLSFVYRILK